MQPTAGGQRSSPPFWPARAPLISSPARNSSTQYPGISRVDVQPKCISRPVRAQCNAKSRAVCLGPSSKSRRCQPQSATIKAARPLRHPIRQSLNVTYYGALLPRSRPAAETSGERPLRPCTGTGLASGHSTIPEPRWLCKTGVAHTSRLTTGSLRICIRVWLWHCVAQLLLAL